MAVANAVPYSLENIRSLIEELLNERTELIDAIHNTDGPTKRDRALDYEEWCKKNSSTLNELRNLHIKVERMTPYERNMWAMQQARR